MALMVNPTKGLRVGKNIFCINKVNPVQQMPCKTCDNCGHKVAKATRKPNAYNIFVKDAMQRPEIQGLSSQKDRMRAAAKLWRESKSTAGAVTS